jgi:hypothetical protein
VNGSIEMEHMNQMSYLYWFSEYQG